MSECHGQWPALNCSVCSQLTPQSSNLEQTPLKFRFMVVDCEPHFGDIITGRPCGTACDLTQSWRLLCSTSASVDDRTTWTVIVYKKKNASHLIEMLQAEKVNRRTVSPPVPVSARRLPEVRDFRSFSPSTYPIIRLKSLGRRVLIFCHGHHHTAVSGRQPRLSSWAKPIASAGFTGCTPTGRKGLPTEPLLVTQSCRE